ncbi:hypothetical protein HZS_7565 [Henneguya salminicola]|nr:hypothetical protein HZS_7565 [Henneguya salminicola]
MILFKKYIDGKSLCLKLYTGQIYEKLLRQLREQFSYITYKIPSKKWVLVKIRENRGACNLNLTQAISKPPFSLNRNSYVISMENSTKLLHGQPTNHYHPYVYRGNF